MELTREQTDIVAHRKGIALVTAGAGCGKTTVLIEYVIPRLRLQQRGSRLGKLLVLTFSTKACQELRERLEHRLTEENLNSQNVDIKTYDAFGLEIISQYHEQFGFSKPPSLVNDAEILNSCVTNAAKDKEINRKTLMKDVLTWIETHGQVKNDSIHSEISTIHAVLQQYGDKKREQNLVDFSDMVGLLSGKGKKWLKETAQQYQYLLVDELQDTNVQQTKMLITLAKNIPTSVMVGDPKQSINRFRGAYARNWQTIEKKLSPTLYPLTETRRIPRAGLAFINAIGQEIHQGKHKQLVSKIKGDTPYLVFCDNTHQQAEFIANEVKRLIASGKAKPEEIVCLGRTRRMLSDLSLALEAHDIPTQELYREPETYPEKILRNLLRLTQCLRNDGFELPQKRRKTLSKYLIDLGATASETEKFFERLPKKGWQALTVKANIKDKGRNRRNPAYRRVLDFQKLVRLASESEEIEKVVSYLMDALKLVLRQRLKHNPQQLKRTLDYLMRDLTRLKIDSRQFDGWDDLVIKALHGNRQKGGIQLSTINDAKGKEWMYVFVIHCIDGILPIHYAKNKHTLNEERNLFYVAITRHKKALYLMKTPASVVSYKNGRRDIPKSDISCFIEPYQTYLSSHFVLDLLDQEKQAA